MKTPLYLLLASIAVQSSFADDYSRTIFADDFSTNAFGPRWGHYKSASVVREGVLVGITPEGSDHAAVDSVRFDPERDLEVSVKFKFASEKAKQFNVWFDDRDFKGSHAGHIFNVMVGQERVTIGDAKTGNFRNDLYEKKKASPPALTEEDKKFLATKNKSLPVKISMGEWHTLVLRTKAEEVFVSIDGKSIGSFHSEGVGHDHKTLVSLTTYPVDVHYDDFSIKAVGK